MSRFCSSTNYHLTQVRDVAAVLISHVFTLTSVKAHDCEYCLGGPFSTPSPPASDITDRGSTRIIPTAPTNFAVESIHLPALMSARIEAIAPKTCASGRNPLIKTALSVLADQYPGEYINPEAYATRSAEERQRKSIEEGKISRPLNSYMLYRKAYQQVARRVLSNDQQQFASQIVGISWNQYESPTVKADFKALAKIDHQMHHKAFPSYKYTPTQGRNPRGASDSKKLSGSIERRMCRRSGLKEIDPHGGSGKKLNRSNTAEAIGQHQSRDGSISMNWLPQTLSPFPPPLMHPGGQHDRFEQYIMPESTYFDAHYPDIIDDNTFGHFSRQPVPLTAGPAECLTLESCIDPSLFSRFESINIPQNTSRYVEWQSPEAPIGHGSYSITPDMNMGQPTGSGYDGQEEWPVEHGDERRPNFGWHSMGENSNR